jgi:hypothetical protein
MPRVSLSSCVSVQPSILPHANGRVDQNGLFSAVVAALVVLSIADLKPDPQEKSAYYLEKIYLIQATGNASNSSAVEKFTFSTPGYSIWANSLWLLSLVISLTCAMLATSVQQWARRYIRITQPAGCSPKQRARMRAFFANGVDNFHVSWAVEALPALVHLSLVIFFAGLLIFLFNLNLTVFTAVLGWIGLLALVYGTITLMPIFRPDSPFYAPLSGTAWFVYASIQDAFVNCRWDIGSIQSAAEEAALARSSEIDVQILEWTIDALGEDEAQEKFFESLPDFYQADLVRDPLRGLPEEIEWKILRILNDFLRRSLSSNSISGLVKCRRLAICLNVASEVRSSFGIRFICRRIIEEINWSLVPESVDIGHFLRSWDKSTKERYTQYIQGIIAHIVAGVWERNDRWMKLTAEHLGISEHLLHDYLAQGDTVLLADLIHLIRLLSRTDWVTPDILRPLTRFDVRNTHPGVQHDFCAMWNELVLESRSKGALTRLRTVLKAVRPIYRDLHQDEAGTSRSKYPLCTNVEHRSGWTQDVQDVSVLSIGEPIHPHASTSASVMVQHPSRATASTPSRAAVTSSSPPALRPDHTTLRRAGEESRRDLPGPSVQSSHPAHQLPPPDPPIPVGSAASTPILQATASSSDLPSTTIPDPRSTAAATALIQQPASTQLSTDTDSPHDDEDHHPVTPPVAPEAPISPSPTSHSSDAVPTDEQSATSTATQLDPSRLSAEDPLTITATSPPTVGQETSDTLHDDLQDPNIPTPTVDSQYPHHSTQPVPDISGNISTGSLDTLSSSF